MAYRFTTTEKQEDAWFRQLSLEAKVLFEFLRDKCDCAGFWEIDLSLASFYTGIPLKDEGQFKPMQSTKCLQDAIKELEKAYFTDGQYIWLRNFLYHQKNLPLNPQNKLHKAIIDRIKSHNSFSDKILRDIEEQIQKRGLLAPNEGLLSPTGNSKGNIKGGVGGNEGFDVFWKAYPRKAGKGKLRDWWKKHKPTKELLTKILNAIEQQKKTPQWRENGGRFIPHPITWLNQERWDDEVELKPSPNSSVPKRYCPEPIKIDKIATMEQRKEIAKRAGLKA